MKNTIKRKIADYILDSLPEYDSKNSLNVKLTKGNPITLEQYLKALRCFKSKWSYNSLKNDHRKLNTESYANVFARNMIERNTDYKGSQYKRTSEENLQMVLFYLNKELHQKIVDMKVQQCVKNRLDHLQAIETIREARI